MRDPRHFQEFAIVASPAKVVEFTAQIEAIEAAALVNSEVAAGIQKFMHGPFGSLRVFAEAGSLDGVLVALDVHMSTARAASEVGSGGAVAVSSGINKFYYEILIGAVNSKTITDRHIDVIAHFTVSVEQIITGRVGMLPSIRCLETAPELHVNHMPWADFPRIADLN